MVTHQLQDRCRPVKVRRSETDVLPLSHPTKWGGWRHVRLIKSWQNTTLYVKSMSTQVSSIAVFVEHTYNEIAVVHFVNCMMMPGGAGVEGEGWTGTQWKGISSTLCLYLSVSLSVLWYSRGLTSPSTHYRSFRRRFYGSYERLTQPTVS